MSDELALMVVRMRGFDLAVVATQVQEVVPLERWTEDGALDLAQLVGGTKDEGTARILVVTREGRPPLAALVSGAVTMRYVARAQLLALPAPLAAHVEWISHVVVTDGQPPLLVLDAERLGA